MLTHVAPRRSMNPLEPHDPWDPRKEFTPPTDPNPPCGHCPRCGIELRRVMHYCCMNYGCPTGLGRNATL